MPDLPHIFVSDDRHYAVWEQRHQVLFMDAPNEGPASQWIKSCIGCSSLAAYREHYPSEREMTDIQRDAFLAMYPLPAPAPSIPTLVEVGGCGFLRHGGDSTVAG